MKKLLFSAWLLMLSMVATAQSFVIVDKNGNKTTYDVSKLDSVTFQQNPPSFTVYKEADPEPSQGGETPADPKQETTTFTFDEVQSIAGDPKFLFAHPDTVFVGADGQTFAFQLRSNVTYDYTPSDRWLTFGHTSDDTDSLYFAAAMNPNTRQRLGYIAFVNKNDATMRDTIYVVQYGKRDSRYIDINWERTSVESYNRETGRAVLVFQAPIPVMGDHDVTLLPGNETYEIRIIDDVQQLSDTKVQLDTREGKMGNLFKDQQFTLCSDPNYDPSESGPTPKSSYAPAISGPIYYPESIELLQNGKPVAEVYNRAMRRDSKLEKEFNIFEYKYDNSGAVIWEKGAHNVSWQECKFDVGLKGIFAFDFGDVEWENVRFGDLKNFKAYLDGDFNTDLILKYTLTKGVEASVEKTLVKDIFSYRVKFMVGPVPVWINLSSDLMASVEAKAEAQVSVSGGVRAQAQFKGGVEWDADRGTHPISSFDYQYEIVKPEVEAEAHAEAKAYVWPQINIGIYDVLAPTINPKPYVRAYADARSAEANKPFFGWNAGISAGIDLTLGLSLQLWKWKKEIAEIDPINLVDRDLVAIPSRIEIADERLSRNVMKGDTCHVKYRVKGYNAITGSEYSIPLACVKIEKNGGGEIDSEQWKGADYFYTNMDGEVDVVYTQTDENPATLKATLITGDEDRDKETKEWHTVYYDYRFTAPDADEPEHSVQATRAGKADVKYQVEEFVKYNADDEGQWRTKEGVAVVFEPTNGTMEADTVKTNYNGIAIGKFDGGEGFGGGSVAVKAIIEEFDTIYVDKLTINKFSFDDPKLAKAYNLKDNTVLADGVTLNVTSKALGLNLQYPTYGSFRFTAEKNFGENNMSGANRPVKHFTEDDDACINKNWYWTDRVFQVDNAGFKTENIQSIPEERDFGFCAMTDSMRYEYEYKDYDYKVKTYYHIYHSFTGEYDTWTTYSSKQSTYALSWGAVDNYNNRPINGKICEFKEKDKYVVIFYIIRDDNKDVYAKIVFDEGEEMKYFGY
ncbi:MAG: BACON domain-containing protein [Prevotella sp.]|nr:BACON domain-containing protein [Prevotella sp.]